mmetsp:Transcript_88262/g.140341  ORF Transcript_88262/g.140341 Transcript_88262/m.140341 type:complete len:167 (-) Transcript_88262:50-550(-)
MDQLGQLPGLDRNDPFGQKKAKLVAEASLRTPNGLSPKDGGNRSRPDTSRPVTGSDGANAGLDDMWDALSIFSLRDHVSSLLQQPLPTRGEGIKDYAKESSIGPLPVPPPHLSQTPSEVHGNFVYSQQLEAGIRGAQASELWRGFQKNDQTEFNEARVHMGHIMRK